MTGGRKNKKAAKKEKRASSSGASSSISQPEPQVHPQVQQPLTDEDVAIYEMCEEIDKRYRKATNIESRDEACKELLSIVSHNPNSAVPALFLSGFYFANFKLANRVEDKRSHLLSTKKWAEDYLKVDSHPHPIKLYAVACYELACIPPLKDKDDRVSLLESALRKIEHGTYVLSTNECYTVSEDDQRSLDECRLKCEELLPKVKEEMKKDEEQMKAYLEALALAESDSSKTLKSTTRSKKKKTVVVEKATCHVEEEEEEQVEEEKKVEEQEKKEEEKKKVEEKKLVSVQYAVTGNWKEYLVGFTCFRDEYDEERKKPINIIKCIGVSQSNEVFENLSTFSNERIARCHLVTSEGVMIESVNSDIESWIEDEHSRFKNYGSSSNEWWSWIENNFKTIFRDVLLALQFLYKGRAYCGDLTGSISVINRRSAKLCQVKVAHGGDLCEKILEDIADVRSLMMNALLWNESDKSTDVLERMGVPIELRRFLDTLSSSTRHTNILWLLDEAFFWGSIEKYSFITKLIDEKALFYDWAFHLHMEELLEKEDLGKYLEHIVHDGSVEQRVYEHGLKLQKEVKKEVKEREGEGSSHLVVYEEHIFLGLVVYFNNLVKHYNHHHPLVKLKLHQRIDHVDKLFDGACSLIRIVMVEQASLSNRLGFYLSNVPY